MASWRELRSASVGFQSMAPLGAFKASDVEDGALGLVARYLRLHFGDFAVATLSRSISITGIPGLFDDGLGSRHALADVEMSSR